MHSLGIDLAAQPANTAMCVVRWDDRVAVVEAPIVGADDTQVLDAMARADWTGIDAPFGWPERFVEAVYGYHHDARWPEAVSSADLRLRVTDRFVTRTVRAERGVSVLPLSVSSERIATCAFRCAALLGEHHRRAGTELDRTGTHGVLEAYPAAALAMWGLPHRGYKTASAGHAVAARGQREAIIAGLEAGRGGRLVLSADARAACLASDHGLDALISALVASAAARGETILPGPDEHGPARLEGWIHLPGTRNPPAR